MDIYIGLFINECAFVLSQEAEAILADIIPSPWQLLGYGTVRINCQVTYMTSLWLFQLSFFIYHFGWILRMLMAKLIL